MKGCKLLLHAVDKLFELWLLPIFKSHPELSIDKRFPLRESLHSVHLRNHIEKCWTNELLASIDTNRKPQFLYAAWRCYGPAYVIVSTCLLIIEFLCVLQALIYYYYVFQPSLEINLSLWGVSLLYVTTKHLWKASVTHMGIQLRVSLQTLLLKKVLLIDTNDVYFKDLNSQVGEVVRRLSNLDNLFLYTPYIFVAFLYIIAAAVVLEEYYKFSSSSIMLTIAILLILIPYQVLLAYKSDAAGKNYIRQSFKLGAFLNEYRKSRDEVKAYGLKNDISNAIRKKRLTSRSTLLASYTYECVLFLISLNYTKVVIVFFLAAHSWFDEVLPEEKVLLCMAFLEIFMYPLSVALSRSITLTAEFVKTINSLQDVLMMLDKATPNLEDLRKDTDVLIEFNDIQAVSSPFLTLRCDKMVVERGQTIAFPHPIEPQTKKTLLRLLTGEIDVIEGTACVYGKVSFCSKKPWLYPRASVKQNILSSHFYNSQKYQRVLNICNLNHDFQFLPDGENTIIGCKGDVNVTKHLATKISIARVLYRDAEVYIFDGILDRLSAQASNKMLQQIISRAMNELKCVIIFSQRPWLSRQTQRSFNVVYDKIHELDARKEKIDYLSDYIEGEEEQPEEDVSDEHFKFRKFTSNFRDVRVAWKVTQNAPSMPRNISLLDLRMNRKKNAMNTRKKNKAVSEWGGWKVLSRPFKSIGTAMVFTVLLGIVFSSFSMHIISAAWIYICLNQSIMPTLIDDPILQLLLVLCISTSILFMIQLYWLAKKFLDAIYDGLVTCLFNLKHWQLRDWESILFIMQSIHPKLDINFAGTVVQCVKRWLIYLVAVTIMVIYTPIAVVQGVAMSLCLAYIVKYCAGYVTKLWHLQDELWGIVEVYYKFKDEQIISLRALRSSEKYRKMFNEHMDNYTSIQYMAKSAVEGLSFWMGLISVMNIGLLLLLDLTIANVDNQIALFYSMLLPNLFPLLIEHTIQILYYAGHLNMALHHLGRKPEEEVERIEENGANCKKGFVESKFVVCKFNSRIVYLHFTVNPGEMVGVLGDGRFSVMALLFGFIEVINGKVCVENTSNSIRNGFIPDDPHIFNGVLITSLALEKNLDEASIWSAVEKVGMDREIATLPSGLKTSSQDWRSKFTHYQRQLLYLAANIAVGSSLVAINFDPTLCSHEQELDVMEKARKHLLNSTIFILSNRLRTVLRTDKIMVFKMGALLEFESTTALVQDNSSCLNSYINAIKQRCIKKELRDSVIQCEIDPDAVSCLNSEPSTSNDSESPNERTFNRATTLLEESASNHDRTVDYYKQRAKIFRRSRTESGPIKWK